MIAVDTNVIIRFLVRDDAHQAELVYKIFKNAEKKGDVLFVSLLVALEMIWVLESVYAFGRSEILDSFDDLLSMPVLEFESKKAVRNFIALSRKTEIDLPDMLIAAAAANSGCDHVLTFDRKAAKSEFFRLISSIIEG
jgi:predicted nucleic-acid-binding protein